MTKIVKVEVGRYSYNFVGEFKFFKPDADGVVRRPSILVRLTDADGNQGWGQGVPVPTWTYETTESVETTISNYLAPAILGADPADMADIHYRMHKAIMPGLTVGMPLAKAAVDTACYDLVGKQTDQRVVDLLGGPIVDSLTLNWTINSLDLAVIEQQLQEGKDRGYDHYTIKVGPPQAKKFDIELVTTVRDFAPDSFLWVDANTSYSLDDALEMAPKFADLGVQAFESPMAPTRIRAYQHLKKQGALPIYMDEGIIAPEPLREYIALGMLDGVTMKPGRCAGIYPSQRIVEIVRANGLKLLGSGLSDPDIALAAAVHVYAWAGMTAPCALNGPQFLAESIATNNFIPKTGTINLPDGPGLGLEYSDELDEVFTVAAQL